MHLVGLYTYCRMHGAYNVKLYIKMLSIGLLSREVESRKYVLAGHIERMIRKARRVDI